MTAKNQDVEIYQGDYTILEVTATDDDSLPITLSGVALTWVLYNPVTETVTLTKTTPNEIIVTDSDAGEFQVILEETDTLNLRGLYKHECELEDSASRPYTLFEGQFKILLSKANN
jgi:hypothetical protein